MLDKPVNAEPESVIESAPRTRASRVVYEAIADGPIAS